MALTWFCASSALMFFALPFVLRAASALTKSAASAEFSSLANAGKPMSSNAPAVSATSHCCKTSKPARTLAAAMDKPLPGTRIRLQLSAVRCSRNEANAKNLVSSAPAYKQDPCSSGYGRKTLLTKQLLLSSLVMADPEEPKGLPPVAHSDHPVAAVAQEAPSSHCNVFPLALPFGAEDHAPLPRPPQAMASPSWVGVALRACFDNRLIPAQSALH
jgi:hypothetical protein